MKGTKKTERATAREAGSETKKSAANTNGAAS